MSASDQKRKTKLPNGRLVVSALLAPLVPPIFIILVAIVSTGSRQTSIGDIIAITYMMGLPFLAITLPIQTLITLAIHWFLTRIGKANLQSYILAGFVTGAIIGISAIYIFATAMGNPIYETIFGLGTFIGGPVGAIALAMFRLLRGPHKPLTQPPNLPT